jgi:hypothetical protein
MSQEALLPCFKCGKTLENVTPNGENQPYAGTEFRTEGHYGSTFWDSFDGEEIVINICDPCLHSHTQRIAQHKRYLPVRCEGMTGFGRQWVDRPMVPYTGNPDNTKAHVNINELGTPIKDVEWVSDIEELRLWMEQKKCLK